jgi:molybdenum cofactor cytidylyltransferase
MSVAALVLAGGSSRRFGTAKQLVDWGGRPLLEHVVAAVSAWPVDEVWVVLGDRAEEIMDTVDLGGAGVVVNERHAEGIATSLKVGLDAIARCPRVERVFIVMGDQPAIDPEVPGALLAEARATPRPVVVPKYRYARSNPVLVERSLWERLMSLEGDEGARGLIEAHPEWVHEVWFDSLPPRDVDTNLDYDEMRPRRPQ